jgi:hypothetical protein
LEYACKDDVELCEIIGNDIGNTDLVKQWIEKRMRRKRRDFMQPKTRIVMAHTKKNSMLCISCALWWRGSTHGFLSLLLFMTKLRY